MSGEEVYRRLTLSNGVPVLVIPLRHAPVVAVQAWIRYGAGHEGPDANGIAHLFEHLLFKGTDRRPVGAIASEVEGLGGDLNAFTSYDHTVMHMTLPAAAAPQGIDILADALLYSRVEPDELEKEKEVVVEEIHRRNDRPMTTVTDDFRARLYGTHAYARPVLGTIELVRSMTRERLLDEYRARYVTGNMFLVLAGDFAPEALVAECEARFGNLRHGPAVAPVPAPTFAPLDAATVRRPFAHHPTSPDAIVTLGWPGLHARDLRCAALDAFALIVGQGDSSRLVRKLVNDEKLVHSIGAGSWTPRERGLFSLSFRAERSAAAKLPRILALTREMFEARVTESELEKARANLLSSLIYSKETVDGMAQRYGYLESVADGWSTDQEYMEQAKNLRTRDLEEVRDTLVDWQRTAVAGIFPARERLPIYAPPPPAPRLKLKQRKRDANTGIEVADVRGLKVVVRRFTHLPVFSARWVGWGGLRAEPANRGGLGSLWSRAVTLGAKDRDGRVLSRDMINDQLDRASAGLSAFYGRNSWGLQLDGLSKDFERMFRLLSDVRETPLFDEDCVLEERRHQLNDLHTAADSAGNVVHEIFMKAMFGRHAYGRTPLGSAAGFGKAGPADLRRLHRAMIREPQVLAVVGDVSMDEVLAGLEATCPDERFATHSAFATPRPVPKLTHPIVTHHHLQKEQTHLIVAYPSCRLDDPRRWALSGLSAVLAGQGGRLFLELRDKMSLCYSVYPVRMEAIDGGYFGFSMATSPEKESRALAALFEEIRKLVEYGLGEEEWGRARRFLVGSHSIEHQHFHSQAAELAMNELYGLGYREMTSFTSRIEALSAAEVSQAARRIFQGRFAHPVTAIVGPK